MYAIFETGGKQYKVSEGETIWVEKLPADVGAEVAFDRVLMVSDGDRVEVGAPFVQGAAVKARVVEHGKGPKIRVFKYKNKVNYRKTQGHRQPFTRVTVEKIEG